MRVEKREWAGAGRFEAKNGWCQPIIKLDLCLFSINTVTHTTYDARDVKKRNLLWYWHRTIQPVDDKIICAAKVLSGDQGRGEQSGIVFHSSDGRLEWGRVYRAMSTLATKTLATFRHGK